MPVLTFEIIMLCLMTVAFIAVSVHYARLVRQHRRLQQREAFYANQAAMMNAALEAVSRELDPLDGKGGGNPAFYAERIREIVRKRKES